MVGGKTCNAQIGKWITAGLGTRESVSLTSGYILMLTHGFSQCIPRGEAYLQ